MRSKQLFLLVTALAILAACSTGKLTSSSKTNATTLENSGNYTEAMSAWNQYFTQTPVEQTSGEDFANAAQVAIKAGNTAQAIGWFDQARYKNFASPEMYKSLAGIFKEEDNFSKEMSALEFYTENYGNTDQDVSARLFSMYCEIGETEKALSYWKLMDASSRNQEANLLDYFQINKKLENSAVCDSVSAVILKINPDQTDALDWMAKKYYRAGQDRYDSEMKKYEQNKTRKQYAVLLKELDLVTADFKKALPYLEKLWKQNQTKEYASYFVNIYARFGDEQKVDYYKKHMQ